jgi:RNA-binding protein
MPTVPSTSPRKRALMPSSPLRKRLRGLGHGLPILLQIGKAGVTPRLVLQLTQILFDHELVKVKVGAESPLDRFETADRLAQAPGVNVIQILGNTILLYKRHPQTPRYEGKRLQTAAAELAP